MLKGDNYDVFAVFDGHDGPRAAGFASHALMDMFNSESWKSLTRSSLEAQKENIPLALKEFFKETEKQFFRGIRSTIEEKRSLQAIIPPVSRVLKHMLCQIALRMRCIAKLTCCNADTSVC